jgi:transposase
MKKIIWIGLDVHAASIAMARLDGDAPSPTSSSFPNDPKVIGKTFKKLASEGDVHVCYEAGGCGYEVYRQLTSLGVTCVVIAPSLVPRKPGDRIKTDRRDAEKLVRMYRAGELTPVWVPTEDQEGVRDVLRARDDARKARTAARHRLGKFLLRHGHRFSEGRGWTEKFWRWLGKLRFARPTERLVFEQYVEHVQQLDTRVALFDEEIAKLAGTEPLRERVARLCSLRGVSILTAMVVITELFDLRRFDHPRQLMAYLGLVPSEYSSGSKQQRGGITKTGNAHVRRVLVEAAWAYRHKPAIAERQKKAMKGQPPHVTRIVRAATMRLGKRYGRLVGRGKKQQVAITAVARELVGFMWALEVAPNVANAA